MPKSPKWIYTPQELEIFNSYADQCYRVITDNTINSTNLIRFYRLKI